MKPPLCSLLNRSLWSRSLIGVLSRIFHRRPIKHDMRCKLERGPKGQANLGFSGGMVPWKILRFGVPKIWFPVLWGQNKAKTKLFMVIKCDSKLSAVSPFKYYFIHEALQFVSLNLFLYECKFQCHSILQLVEFCCSTENPVTDISWHTSNNNHTTHLKTAEILFDC